ncbi:DUF4765 family protein [Streptomyces sp. NPDC088116]|uniref:eCIS core domain-containing protein n=1 Tax=Streptomyces sp. NPDC088116 TaxID=3365825 RepID=UPI003822CBBF
MHAQRTPDNERSPDRYRPLARPATARATAGAAAHAAFRGPMTPGRIATLQRLAGNDAVVQRLAQEQEQDRHEHDGACGHTPPVQRSTVPDVLATPGEPFDGPMRTEMEARFNRNLSHLRTHTDTAAQRSAAEINAEAYTSRNHMVFTQRSMRDPHVVAHEIAHTIDQENGPVPGTLQSDGTRMSSPGDDGEKSAEAKAREVMSKPVAAGPVTDSATAVERSAGSAAEPAVQRVTDLSTTATTLTEDDSDYSSEDDLTAQEKHLPSPTSESAVKQAVDSGADTTVILYRGEIMQKIRRMVQNSSAGGAAPDGGTQPPSDEATAKQAHSGRLLPEFTTDPYIARQYSRQGPKGIIVVEINTRYLKKCSAPENGWAAEHSAPVKVLAVVDRSDGKPADAGMGVNAS